MRRETMKRFAHIFILFTVAVASCVLTLLFLNVNQNSDAVQSESQETKRVVKMATSRISTTDESFF